MAPGYYCMHDVMLLQSRLQVSDQSSNQSVQLNTGTSPECSVLPSHAAQLQHMPVKVTTSWTILSPMPGVKVVLVSVEDKADEGQECDMVETFS